MNIWIECKILKKLTGWSLFLNNKKIFLSSDVEIECVAKFSISFKSWSTVFWNNLLLFSKHLQIESITLQAEDWFLLKK